MVGGCHGNHLPLGADEVNQNQALPDPGVHLLGLHGIAVGDSGLGAVSFRFLSRNQVLHRHVALFRAVKHRRIFFLRSLGFDLGRFIPPQGRKQDRRHANGQQRQAGGDDQGALDPHATLTTAEQPLGLSAQQDVFIVYQARQLYGFFIFHIRNPP